MLVRKNDLIKTEKKLNSDISNINQDITNIRNNYIPREHYAEIPIAVADVNSASLTCVKTLTGATTASHPLIGCLTTSADTKDDELEAFGTILSAETGTNNITFTFSEVPSSAFTVQVVDF